MAREINVLFPMCSPWCVNNLAKSLNLYTNQVTMDSYKKHEQNAAFTGCLVGKVCCGHWIAALFLHKQKCLFRSYEIIIHQNDSQV